MCGVAYLAAKKGKVHAVQALRLYTGRTAHRGSRGIALPFHDHSTRRGEGSTSRPGRSLPPGKTRYPLYRRLGVPQGRSGQVRKISPPPGFDPRTVQPLASRYTDWATRHAPCRKGINNLFEHLWHLTKNILIILKLKLYSIGCRAASDFQNTNSLKTACSELADRTRLAAALPATPVIDP